MEVGGHLAGALDGGQHGVQPADRRLLGSASRACIARLLHLRCTPRRVDRAARYPMQPSTSAS